jgi:hypothetical protein
MSLRFPGEDKSGGYGTDVMLSASEASHLSDRTKARFFAGVYPESVEGAQNDIAGTM